MPVIWRDIFDRYRGTKGIPMIQKKWATRCRRIACVPGYDVSTSIMLNAAGSFVNAVVTSDANESRMNCNSFLTISRSRFSRFTSNLSTQPSQALDPSAMIEPQSLHLSTSRSGPIGTSFLNRSLIVEILVVRFVLILVFAFSTKRWTVIFFQVIVDRCLQAIAGEIRAVHFLRRQATQLIRHVLTRDLVCLLDGLPHGHIRGDARRRDGRGAAKGLELDVLDAIVIYLDHDAHHVAANGIPDLANTIRVFHLSGVVGIREMRDGFWTIHGCSTELLW